MTLPELAKLSVETFVKEKKIIEAPADLSQKFLEKKSGVFVTIEQNGQLRGCIGTYLPTRKNIAEEIIHNAIATATEDYRFGTIQEKELDSLSYVVYILSEPEPVKDTSELNPKKFGIIVKTASRCGLLLPDLADIDTLEEQISIACQKGDINPQEEKISIYRFTVEKHAQ